MTKAYVIVMVIATLDKGIFQRNKNNEFPPVDSGACVVAKRTRVSQNHHHNAGDITGAQGMYTISSTTCYVTVEVESKDRMELQVG